MDEVKFLTNKLKLDVLCLTETWLTPLIVDSSISIDGYSIFRRDRADGRRGGGVCIFTKTHCRLMNGQTLMMMIILSKMYG